VRAAVHEDKGDALSYDPAGHDQDLRQAMEELRVGRWMTMRDLLRTTGADWELRTSRSQILASAAALTDVVTLWLQEEPKNQDAQMMAARVAAERLLLARRRGAVLRGNELSRARSTCFSASKALPADPVPWITLLALAPLDPRQPEHRVPGPGVDQMLFPGPWQLLEQANARHRGNREAHHRMLRFFEESPEAVSAYTSWLETQEFGVQGSSLHVLPLHVEASNFRRRAATDPMAHLRWQSARLQVLTDRAWEAWFLTAPPKRHSALDLNHLAHALYAGFKLPQALRVFDAIGPYATQWPWAHVADDPEAAFLQARQHARWATAQQT
jgi:hypothetical protein